MTENYSLHRFDSLKQILQIFARFHIIHIWFQMNDFHLYDLFNIITIIIHLKIKSQLLVTENSVSGVWYMLKNLFELISLKSGGDAKTLLKHESLCM